MSGPEFRRVATIFNYFFGKVDPVLPKEGYKLVFSPKSGRVKQIYHDGKLFATIRPDGSVALTSYSALKLLKSKRFLENCIYIKLEASEFIKKGMSVFNKFVVKAGRNIRPGGEVVILDESGKPLAIGTSLLSWKYMREFKRGIAVKVRKCIEE